MLGDPPPAVSEAAWGRYIYPNSTAKTDTSFLPTWVVEPKAFPPWAFFYSLGAVRFMMVSFTGLCSLKELKWGS